MGLPKLWGKNSDGTKGFVFSHIKTIYYNYAQKKLLSTKLDEIDALIDQKIAKAMMSNVQVNDQNKVPTSALAYAMQQQITENEEAITGLNNNIGYNYSYDGVKTFNEVYSNMSFQSTILFEIAGGSTIANELNYPNHSDFGATIFAWKVRTWRGGAIAIPSDGWANTPIYIGMISGEANNFKWLPLVTNNDKGKAIYSSDLFQNYQTPIFVRWDANTENTPFKAGLTTAQLGFAFIYGNPNNYFTAVAIAQSERRIYTYSKTPEKVSSWQRSALQEELPLYFSLNFGTIQSKQEVSRQVSFENPLINSYFSAIITTNSKVSYWADIVYLITNKTVNGCTITAYNNGGNTTGTITADCMIVPQRTFNE